MVFQRINEITFEDAKKHTKVIIEVINEFLESAEIIAPNTGYGDMAKSLTSLQSEIDSATTKFLSSDRINDYTSTLFDAFSTMNPDLKSNLQKLFEAYREIGYFIHKNNADIEFRLLDFEHSRITDIKQNNEHLNPAFETMKNSNYSDAVTLRSIFSIFSSIIETSEKLHRDELIKYRNKLSSYAESNDLEYTVPFDPVDVFSIGNVVSTTNNRKYTKQRALRHLIDHHHVDFDSDNKQIRFKSPDNDPSWKFDFDETFSFEQFCKYVGIVDAFYKSAVCLMLTFELLGTLREHFQTSISLKTRLKMQYLLNHLNQHPYFSKN